MPSNSLQGFLRNLPYLARQLSDCLSGKSTRGIPGGRFVGEGGFRSQELDGCEMTLGFRQVRAARERNTLRPVFCVLYELDDDE